MVALTSQPLLIVPDTNVIVSGGTISTTPPGEILNSWRDGKLDFALSDPILSEVEATFSKPYFTDRVGWTKHDVSGLIHALREGSLIVQGTTPITVSPDPKDNPIFATAVEANADYIVSGDKKHILAIPTHESIKTITPRDFVEQVLRIREAA